MVEFFVKIKVVGRELFKQEKNYLYKINYGGTESKPK